MHLVIPGRPNHVVVTIAWIDGGRIRLGFDADDDIEIIRTELLDRENPGRNM